MTTAATSLLGLALPVTGELSGTWGDTVNNSITSLLDSAVAGTTTLSTDADVTLTTTTLAANQAREAIILWTAAGTVTRTITAPAQSKTYVVINSSSTQSIKLVGAGPTAGITVLPGESTYAAWNGSDFVKVGEYGGNLTVNSLTTTASTTGSTNKGPLNYGTLSFSDTGIVQSAQTSVNSYFQNVMQNTSAGTAASAEFIAYNDQGTASTNYATVGINSSGYTGTGSINAPGYAYFLSASTDLVLGTIGANGIHFTTNSSATDALAISSVGAVSLPGGTANGVAYLNGSKVVTTGSALVFDGINLGLGVTPSAWASTQKVLEFNNGSLFASTVAIDLAQNAYLNTSSAFIYKATGYASFYQQYQGQHQWYNAPSGTAGNTATMTQAMTLDAGGNLGIGTSSPANKLDIRNDTSGTQIRVSTSDNGNIFYAGWATGASYIAAAGYNSPALAFQTGGSERMRLDSSGNLGLGVTPSANSLSGSGYRNFELGTGAGTGLFGGGNELYAQTNSYYNTGFKYAGTGAATQYLQSAGLHKWYIAPSGTAGNAITFTQAMTLDASGNLGLGVTPSAWTPKALQIGLGASFIGGTSFNTTDVGNNIYGNYSYLATGQASFYRQYQGAHSWFTAPSGTAGNAISFTQAMTLDSSGNLGLGVTPSAWSGTKAFQTGSGGVPTTALWDISNNTFLTNGTYWNGSNYIYIATSFPAARYVQSSGAHSWSTAAGGTAGNAITFTQAMTLDASGALLLGATSNLNSAKMLLSFTSSNNGLTIDETSNSSGTQYIRFSQSGTITGSITRVAQTSAVTYNTTSDYRLKNVIGAVTGSGERIDALNPIEYTWVADGTRTRGFLAHEFQEVYPHSVTGAKDAVDAEGNPVYQAMQASSPETIADLVAEIKDLRKRLAALEAK